MSSDSPSPKPQFEGSARSPDDVLPAVDPPSAGFILQLFFIPLVIVSIVIMVWLLFSWIAQADSDPRDLVQNLKRLNDSSWQSALSLAEQLKNPEYDALKDDHLLAKDLAAVLHSELKVASDEESRLRLRIFLCRALGEFRVADGLDALLDAAMQQQQPAEISVRAAAVEALAVMANAKANKQVRHDPRVLEAIVNASQERNADADSNHLAAELRSRASFALGLLDQDAARERLVLLLDDAYPNVRYNAATGLARHGDLRATPTLLEMLNPANTSGWVDEQSEGEKQRKSLQVLLNGVRATFQLLDHPAPVHGTGTETERLHGALESLTKSADFPAAEAAAVEALDRLHKRPSASSPPPTAR